MISFFFLLLASGRVMRLDADADALADLVPAVGARAAPRAHVVALSRPWWAKEPAFAPTWAKKTWSSGEQGEEPVSAEPVDGEARITEKLSPRSGAVDMQEFDFQWAVGGATRQRGSTGHARPAPLGADRKDPAQRAETKAPTPTEKADAKAPTPTQRADAKAPTPAQKVGKKAPAPKQKADKKAPMPTPKDATKNSAAIRERNFQTKGRQGWQPQQQVFFPWAPSTAPGQRVLRAPAPRSADPQGPAGLAILFDCDGVLADTEKDGHRVSFNKVFEEKGLGFAWDVAEYGRLCEVGGGKERMTYYMNANDAWPAGYTDPETEELTGPKGLPKDPRRLALVKDCHARKTALFQDLIAAGTVPLRPGVLRIVDAAVAADVPLAVCSTSNEAAVRTLVTTLMGDERAKKFSFFCGDAVKNKKPAPDVYNLAAETLGLDKSRCVVVEDSGIGNQAAKAAGMTCLVTTSTYTAEEDFTGADRIVPELGEPGGVVCVTLDDLRELLPSKQPS